MHLLDKDLAVLEDQHLFPAVDVDARCMLGLHVSDGEGVESCSLDFSQGFAEVVGSELELVPGHELLAAMFTRI